jgi:hypothetical protein
MMRFMLLLFVALLGGAVRLAAQETVEAGDRMRRREFISLLSGAAIVLPRAALTQVAAKRALVAVLVAASSTAAARYMSGFPQGLQELGYVEGT